MTQTAKEKDVELVTPTVTGERKKKKRKYSRGLKDVQRGERRVSNAARRVARAVSSGLGTYIKRRNRSARKQRDGAVVDLVSNTGRGLSKALRTASPVVSDLSRVWLGKRDQKAIRRAVRLNPFL